LGSGNNYKFISFNLWINIFRWSNSGTNTGPLFGNPPTGKQFVVTGFDLFRISNGKIMEMWQQYNFAPWP